MDQDMEENKQYKIAKLPKQVSYEIENRQTTYNKKTGARI